MTSPLLETFPALQELEGFAHGLTLRNPGVAVRTDMESAVERLRAHFMECVSSLGFASTELVTGEQIHGKAVAVVEKPAATVLDGVDGLISDRRGILLGVYVADCCAVYLVDRKRDAFGLVHSGKEGTRLGIVPRAIELMSEKFGSRAGDLRVQLSPCIRPPHYEIDFAATIRGQCRSCGVEKSEIFDEGTSTAVDLDRYYSYRVEKGKTGRMLALLGRRNSG